MIILLTNDDGIEAPGLAALRKATEQALDAEIFTVAPRHVMSQVGHRVTTHEPIPVEQIDERSWSVAGTPADCVRVALAHLLPKQPDWVLSGINHGGNMGHDIYISGTVAAVREAAYLGRKGIAFSHYMRKGAKLEWEPGIRRVAKLLPQLIDEELDEGEHWNVNLPHVDDGDPEPEPRRAEPARPPLDVAYEESAEGLRYTGVYAERRFDPGSDVDVCFGGNISVTKLGI